MNWHRRKYTHRATMSSPKCDQDNMHANLLIEKIFHQFDPNVSKEKKKSLDIYIYPIHTNDSEAKCKFS